MKRLEAYQRAVNEIDDFFEYRYRSCSPEEIKKFVDNTILNLVKRIVKTGANYHDK